MKAYLIASVTITDRERFAPYREPVTAIVEQYGGRFLVRGGTMQPLEGDLGIDKCVVIEFPSMEAARRFYDSPEYAPWLKLRAETSHSLVALVEGFIRT